MDRYELEDAMMNHITAIHPDEGQLDGRGLYDDAVYVCRERRRLSDAIDAARDEEDRVAYERIRTRRAYTMPDGYTYGRPDFFAPDGEFERLLRAARR